MAGLTDITPDWICGITNQSIINGLVYVDNNTGTPEYFIGDKSMTVTKDSTTIRNYTSLLALILANDNALTIDTLLTTGEDKYITPKKAADIVYCARYINSYIVSTSNTHTATLSGPDSDKIGKYDQRFIDNNLGGKLICRITSASIQYLRQFTISGVTITLLDPITGASAPISTLAKGDIFELINSFDILMENLEATTGYPVNGYVKKHIEPASDSYVTFNVYDKPTKLIGEKVVLTYKALTDFKQQFPYENSMRKYGTYTRKEELNFPVTQTSLDYLESTLVKYTEPMLTIELETFRPNKPRKGWKIPVAVDGMATGIFTITGVSETFIHPQGQTSNTPFRLWKVTLANYVDNFSTLIAGLKRKNDLSVAKLATNEIQKSTITFSTIFGSSNDPGIINSDSLPPINVNYTDKTAESFRGTWDVVGTPDSLKLYFGKGFFPLDSVITLTPDTTYFDFTGLFSNQHYSFRLSAVKNGKESTYSATKDVTTNASDNIFTFPSGITPDLWFDNTSFNAVTVSSPNGGATPIGTITSQEGNNITGDIYEATQNIDKSLDFNHSLARVQMPSDSSYRSYGVNAKFIAMASIHLDSISVFSRIAGPCQYPIQEWALYVHPDNQIHLSLLIDGSAHARYVLEIVTTNASFTANSDHKIAVSVDLQTETIIIIQNQNTLSWTIVDYDGISYFTSIADYKAAGGIQNSSSVMYLGNGDTRGYASQYMRGSMNAYAGFKTLALTESQIKTVFT